LAHLGGSHSSDKCLFPCHLRLLVNIYVWTLVCKHSRSGLFLYSLLFA
jgi:hypothetical protein